MSLVSANSIHLAFRVFRVDREWMSIELFELKYSEYLMITFTLLYWNVYPVCSGCPLDLRQIAVHRPVEIRQRFCEWTIPLNETKWVYSQSSVARLFKGLIQSERHLPLF